MEGSVPSQHPYIPTSLHPNIPILHRTSLHPPPSMSTMLNDIRVGLRLLWKDKAFSLTAALTLALCIGANTALFSVVHNVLLRPLPVPESDRIVQMGNAYPGAGRRCGRHLIGGSRLLRPPARDRRVRRAGAVQQPQCEHRPERHAGPRQGHAGDAVVFPAAAHRPRRSAAPSRNRTARSATKESDPQLCALAVSVRRRPRRDRQRHPARRAAVCRGRRDAEGLLLSESRRDAVAPARVHRGAEVRRAAAQQQLSKHRPVEARREHPARAAAGRRDQPEKPGALSGAETAVDQRRLSYDRRPAAGNAGARDQGDAVPDVGRRAVRAAHRLRQRGEPVARQVARAAEGAGDASGARRRPREWPGN